MILLQASPFNFEIILLMMGIFLVVQFVIIGPKQKKREKEMVAYVENLTSGSKVVMNNGIHGKYIKSEETVLIIEVDTNVKLRVDKSAINFDATKALNKA
jgi:preprotein translocase subunit YajC